MKEAEKIIVIHDVNLYTSKGVNIEEVHYLQNKLYIPLKHAISIRCILIMEENVTMNSCGNRPVDAQNVS